MKSAVLLTHLWEMRQRIKDGMWQQAKEIFDASLIYIGLFVLASFIDSYLGSKNSEDTNYNQIWIFRYMTFLVVFYHIVVMRKDFELPGVSYIDTKWIQILGDLVTSSIVLLISILMLVIVFACSINYRKKQAEKEAIRRNRDYYYYDYYDYDPIFENWDTASACGFALIVVIILAGVFAIKHYYTNTTPITESVAQQLAGTISEYLLLGIPLTVIIVSIIFLFKHIVQLMGAYIAKGIKRINQWSISKNENEAAISNRKKD